MRLAVTGETEIICDGGVRRGSDIVKALAMGANVVMAGRPYLSGLGAAGEAGVDQVLSNFASEMERTMALIGCTSVEALSPSYIATRIGCSRRRNVNNCMWFPTHVSARFPRTSNSGHH